MPTNDAAVTPTALISSTRGSLRRCASNATAVATENAAMVCSEKNDAYDPTIRSRGHCAAESLGLPNAPGESPVHGRARWMSDLVILDATKPIASPCVAARAYWALMACPSSASCAQTIGAATTIAGGTQNATGAAARKNRLV